jgi:hypothetical protein
MTDEILALPSFDIPAAFDSLPRPAAREWLKRAEAHLQSAARLLRTRHNALAPINALPDELLLSIFSFLANPPFSPIPPSPIHARVSRDRSVPYLPPFPLLAAAVCTRWRYLAMAAPILWTTIDLLRPIFVPVFLLRAAGAPLDAVLARDAPPERMQALVGLLAPHLSQLRSLHVAARLSGMTALLAGLSSVSTLSTIPSPSTSASTTDSVCVPQLESLCLSLHYGRRIPSDPLLVPELFAGATPELRVLHLDHVSVPWRVPIYRHLVDLELVREHSDATPTLAEFRAMLESSPMLRRLMLIRAGPRCPGNPPPRTSAPAPPPRVIYMRHLRKIYLSNCAADTALVLAHIGLPPAASLNITCGNERVMPSLAAIFPSSSHFPCAHLEPLAQIKSIDLHYEADWSLQLTGRAATGCYSLFLHAWDRVSVAQDLHDADWCAALGNVFALPRLERLYIDGAAALSSAIEWAGVLGRFGSTLRELELGATADRSVGAMCQSSLLRALMPRVLLRGGEGNQDGYGVLCPRLEVLALEGFKMDEREGLEMDDDEFAMLRVCFAARRAHGSPLRVLRLGGSSRMDEETCQQLEEHVGTVEYPTRKRRVQARAPEGQARP